MYFEQPLVSIIIPVYNGEKTIRRCVDSILKQTFENFEVIVVNDGSNDNTANILEEYRKTDKRVLVVSQKNAGVSVARNEGMKKAKGKWISFVDADDYLDLNCFKEVFSEEKLEQYDLIFWNYYMVKPLKIEAPVIFQCSKEKYTKNELLKCALDNDGNQMLSCVYCRLFSNQLIKKKRLHFQEEIISNEDRIFMIDYIMCSERFLEIRKHLYYRTLNYDSAMHKWHENARREYLLTAKSLKNRLIEYDKWEILKKDFSKWILVDSITRYLETYICHAENRMNCECRKQELKQYLEEEIISEGLRNLEYRDLTIKSIIKLILIKSLWIELLDKWYRNKEYF